MQIIKFIRILLTIFVFVNFSILKADPKNNIIENINETNSLKFNFIQITNDREEKGICYLKRPHYLKCEYDDKNEKQLIVNKNKLVIYHKRYKKIYNFPLSKSYFTEILSKKKFSEMIFNGSIEEKNNIFVINCFLKKSGEISFHFDIKDFSLLRWDIVGLNNNKITFKILNSVKNSKMNDVFFKIPNIN